MDIKTATQLIELECAADKCDRLEKTTRTLWTALSELESELYYGKPNALPKDDADALALCEARNALDVIRRKLQKQSEAHYASKQTILFTLHDEAKSKA